MATQAAIVSVVPSQAFYLFAQRLIGGQDWITDYVVARVEEQLAQFVQQAGNLPWASISVDIALLDASGVELVGNGYARKSGVAFNGTNFQVSGDGLLTISNLLAIAFAAASGSNWSAAHSVQIYQTAGGNTVLGSGVLSSDVLVTVGNALSFAAGALQISQVLH